MASVRESAIRVILADDHDGIRASIRHMLMQDPNIKVIGEATNGHEALQLVEQLTPDVLVLDVEMPRVNGLQVARRLSDQDQHVRILVLSGYDQREYIQEMLRQGVAGYLTKDEAPELLIEAIHGVWRGENNWLSRRARKRLE